MFNIGDKVRIYFKNNVYLDGEILDPEILSLKLKDGIATMVAIDEILYVKLFNKKDIVTNTGNDDLINQDATSLADIRLQQIEEEKKDLAERMKEFRVSEGVSVSYGTPNFSAFKVPKQYSVEETSSKTRRNK